MGPEHKDSEGQAQSIEQIKESKILKGYWTPCRYQVAIK